MVCSCEVGTGLTVGICSCFPSSGVSGTNKGTLDLLVIAGEAGATSSWLPREKLPPLLALLCLPGEGLTLGSAQAGLGSSEAGKTPRGSGCQVKPVGTSSWAGQRPGASLWSLDWVLNCP